MSAKTSEQLERFRCNIPPELQRVDQWVLWRTEQRGVKPTKVPYGARTGEHAKSTDPATWGSFEDACKAFVGGTYDGIGFVFSEYDPYCGIDLDDCVEGGAIESDRRRWMETLDSYSEFSPTATGVHVIVKAGKPGTRSKNSALGVEMYDRGRFFTMTGDRVPRTTKVIYSRQDEVQRLYDEWFASADDERQPLPTQPIDIDDEKLLEAAFSNPKNGQAIRLLWDGDLTGYASHSEADLALCAHLAFYTGRDAGRIDRMFRSSGLYREGKWDRTDYREGTLNKATASTFATYEPYRNGSNGTPPPPPDWGDGGSSAPADAPEAEQDDDAPGVSPLDVAPNPNLSLGWIDDYAEITSEMTGSPYEFNRHIGLVIVATATQRRARLRMAFGDIYPNIYSALIARSSVFHKTTAMQKSRQVLGHANLDRLLLSELATSEGLLKQLQGQSSGLILRDEIGTLFDSHNTKYLRNLKPDLTALYDCQPYSRRLSNDEIKVERPFLSILGATTPQRFYESVGLTDWMDGFLARWLFVIPEGEPDFDAMTMLYQQKHAEQLTRLGERLAHIDRQREQDFTLVGESHELWDQWQRAAAKEAYYFGDDVTASIVTRYSAYALKFAIILSAANGKEWGRIEPDTMQSAIHLADSYKRVVHTILGEKQNFGISGAKLQKVFKVIAHLQGTGITTSKLQQSCHMKKGELDPCLEKLLEVGAIMRESSGKGFRYFPAVDSLPVKAWR